MQFMASVLGTTRRLPSGSRRTSESVLFFMHLWATVTDCCRVFLCCNRALSSIDRVLGVDGAFLAAVAAALFVLFHDLLIAQSWANTLSDDTRQRNRTCATKTTQNHLDWFYGYS